MALGYTATVGEPVGDRLQGVLARRPAIKGDGRLAFSQGSDKSAQITLILLRTLTPPCRAGRHRLPVGRSIPQASTPTHSSDSVGFSACQMRERRTEKPSGSTLRAALRQAAAPGRRLPLRGSGPGNSPKNHEGRRPLSADPFSRRGGGRPYRRGHDHLPIGGQLSPVPSL